MKYLGIDYGTKRVGIATSDDGGTMAFPLRVLLNSRSLVAHLTKICKDERIDAIVMGESHDRSGKPNPLMKSIVPFTEELKKSTGLPVSFMNEAYSSREAMHLQGDNDMNDASAAALVLQSYLEHLRPQGESVVDDN
jgi:putative Holliday junction resolvase